jgi:hypothetical protein
MPRRGDNCPPPLILIVSCRCACRRGPWWWEAPLQGRVQACPHCRPGGFLRGFPSGRRGILLVVVELISVVVLVFTGIVGWEMSVTIAGATPDGYCASQRVILAGAGILTGAGNAPRNAVDTRKSSSRYSSTGVPERSTLRLFSVWGEIAEPPRSLSPYERRREARSVRPWLPL